MIQLIRVRPGDAGESTGLAQLEPSRASATFSATANERVIPILTMTKLLLFGIFEIQIQLKACLQANVVSGIGKYSHDIISRESCTIEDKNKGVAFQKIIKLCSSYLSYKTMIDDAITGNIDNYLDKQRIIKVFDYQVNQESGDTMMKILNLICTEVHADHGLY